MNKNDVKTSVNIRDELHFPDIHRSMNAIGPCKVNMTLGVKTHRVHTSMNDKKMKFIS